MLLISCTEAQTGFFACNYKKSISLMELVIKWKANLS